MTLDERIKIFTQEFPRPVWETAQNVLRTLIYDMIDDRDRVSFAVTRALLGRNGGKVR